ncbi:type VII secretion protein EccB [Salininema proteolyticum]|uniref:Type VII secretion protein EccB n=1 Tax=Salininema proteolyticum TaxID=1607685 RepID=A0ABV8U3Q0_9ACTN
MAQLRSRREQVEAHKFTTTRMNLALLMGNPDTLERPMRRIGVSVLASVAIMAVILGIFVIVAMLDKGRQDPQLNSIIVDKDSGSVYVYMKPPKDVDVGMDGNGEEAEGLLFPVQNYTSALLMVDAKDEGSVRVQHLKSSSFSHVPRGWSVGIVGAPSQPPTQDQILQDEPWNLCNLPVRPNNFHPLLQLAIGGQGTPDTIVDDDNWLVVKNKADEFFLVAGSRIYKVVDPDGILPTLGTNKDAAVEVKDPWIDALSKGGDLEEPDYPGSGGSGVTVGGRELEYGQVVSTGDEQYVLIEEGGSPAYAPISELQRMVWASYDRLGEPLAVTSSDITVVGAEGDVKAGLFPEGDGNVATVDGEQPAVCGIYTPDEEKEDMEIQVGIFDRAPKTLRDAASRVTLAFDNELPNGQKVQVVIPGSKGVIASAAQMPGQTLETSAFLVDEIGVKYGLVDSESEAGKTLRRLGYSTDMVTPVPGVFLTLIRNGADLDPVEARKQINPSLTADDFDDSLEEEQKEAKEKNNDGAG